MTDAPLPDEAAMAFAHPEARAEGSDARHAPDRISLRDYVLDTEIGAFQTERDTTQRLQFNVVAEVATQAAALGDDVDQVLSYDTITDAIHAALSGARFDLLETLAEHVAELILADPRADRVFVRIEKLDRGPFKLGAEILRSREGGAGGGLTLDLPPFRVVLVGQDPVGTTGPAILVAPPGTAPRAATAQAQRRIDLLALDQAAWGLSAQLADSVVADSRTELDWALRNGKLAVWAPARLVLDSAAPPAEVSPAALALWLAETLGATGLVHQGARPKAWADTDLPVMAEGAA